jgi:hypothetical protein
MLPDQTVDQVHESNDIPIIRILQNCMYIFPTAQEPNSGPGRLVFEVSRLHTIRHTLPVVLPYTNDELVAEAAAYTTHIRDEHRCSQWDSNPRSLQ